ncbi:GNAT family N-acetyltransferase [Oceanirhabdus seepicola]|uniref:GNAT family N-acetyltransferase n=1 Tax=Oceanirhabdus seepicola TaxID=2828781 RepID=A0A9J6NY72_9CLOT|nr:GNAT family N-acetyltransferase [Oceanirhabdus seepicola]MCM1988589.1 GNAT family N-acetyltransferase [Oceanirhabdus seepicola]
MEIRDLDLLYLEDAVSLAQENYEMECKHVGGLPDLNYMVYFRTKLEKLFKSGNGKMAFENNNLVAYLAFGDIFNINEQGDKGATSPLFGYGIRSENRAVTIGKLFQYVAKELCEKYAQSLRINIYAHDIEVLQTYIMSSFSMDVTDVIRDVTEPFELNKCQDYIFKELNKEELKFYRSDIMEFYRGSINHLRMSPVFYHCRYFLPLEDRFDDFLSDDMRIFAAFDGNKLIGMIDSEPGRDAFITGGKGTVCMGDVFLNPDYRGRGIASQMLKYANDKLKECGIKTICVTHGTINPTARGFWDKYFQNYSYTMTRQIDSNMLGIIQPI